MEMESSPVPPLALRLVLDYLSAKDVVSCGQVCQEWRCVAQAADLWQYKLRTQQDIDGLKELLRVMRFAPSGIAITVNELASIDCRSSLFEAFVEAMRETKVQCRDLTLCRNRQHRASCDAVLGTMAPGLEVLTLPDATGDQLWAVSGDKAPSLRELTLEVENDEEYAGLLNILGACRFPALQGLYFEREDNDCGLRRCYAKIARLKKKLQKHSTASVQVMCFSCEHYAAAFDSYPENDDVENDFYNYFDF
ncbi:uncharacterized protein LOC117649750 isoform X2 [Thrips palmi]|uniref:Uncharacterized protein LOC117649750 isoform X2 n=1 Tax=Thrips palmi TaxID=161013 RepID=A0A6P8ZUA0_THRPL|nr:uncharacterized protein LOC117649750 isoform X2 [Thrips palmi]XP_034248665.1 uncharacterized protein LOC117649750 isoform X2 [Thrips palmi]